MADWSERWFPDAFFAGFLAREIARRLTNVDYRALGAAAYLGLDGVWAQPNRNRNWLLVDVRHCLVCPNFPSPAEKPDSLNTMPPVT